MPGTVRRDKYLCLHTRIGTVNSEEGGELEMMVALPLNTPMVVHPDGRTWTLSWEQIAEMAFAAFDADSLAKIIEEVPCE